MEQTMTNERSRVGGMEDFSENFLKQISVRPGYGASMKV